MTSDSIKKSDLLELLNIFLLNIMPVLGVQAVVVKEGNGTHIATFAVRPTSDTITQNPQEVLDVDYFSPNDLPEDRGFWVQQYIDDALSGNTGFYREEKTIWPFDPSMTRKELYALRDQSGLSRYEFYEKYILEPNKEFLA